MANGPKYKRLPKSPNGTQRVHFGGASYKYQRDELKRRAHKKGMTVSYYLAYLLWRDWLENQEDAPAAERGPKTHKKVVAFRKKESA